MTRLGARTLRLAETGSTNDVARELALTGEPEGTVVVARTQTRGRGREGRSWASPAGGLWMSVVLRPTLAPERWGLLPLAFGAGVAAALGAFVDARVKWPNDVLVGPRKVAGLLLESRSGASPFVVAGIGVDANFARADLPAEVREAATSLLEEAGPVPLDALESRVLEACERRYRVLEGGGGKALLEEYRTVSATLGRSVAAGGIEGIAVDVREADGALLVRVADGRVVAVTMP